MHVQTLSWSKLSKCQRDFELARLGVTPKQLNVVRSLEPKKRILEAAKLALGLDDEPNSDLIEYIAGYATRGGVYRHFRTRRELLDIVGGSRARKFLPEVEIRKSKLDLSTAIPSLIENYPVHLERAKDAQLILVWQKVNGGMRSIAVSRIVPRVSFLTGILLYAGEGTRSTASGRVEISNSNPSILRLFIMFLNDLGIPKANLQARVQIHHPEELLGAKEYWMRELELESQQFTSPLVSASGKACRKRTYTLQLRFANTMLLRLLRTWTFDLERVVLLAGT